MQTGAICYINEAGKYKTVIESAVLHIGQNNNGRSENLKLSVIDEQKRKATFFINTSYGNGIQNESGLRTVSAILACLRMHDSGNAIPAQIKEYNRDTQREEYVSRDCFVSMHGNPRRRRGTARVGTRQTKRDLVRGQTALETPGQYPLPNQPHLFRLPHCP